MSTIDTAKIKQLPVADRLSLIEDIWDSIAAESKQLEVLQWHRDVLRRRLTAYQAHPDDGTPWSEVRRRIEQSRK